MPYACDSCGTRCSRATTFVRAGILLSLCLSSAHAAILRVSTAAVGQPIDGSSWGQAYRKIQDAITAATSNDEIWVAEGAYAEVVTLKTGVDVYGGFSGVETERAQRDASTHVCVISSSSLPAPRHTVIGVDDVVLDGFTITGGKANGTGDPGSGTGGGIYINGTTLAISNCIISGNEAGAYGGGVYVKDSAASFTACTFQNNIAQSLGGGNASKQFGAGAYIVNSNIDISDCTFSGNIAAASGGGLRAENSIVDLMSCRVTGNKAGGGAGLFVGKSLVRAKQCLIMNNTLAIAGGGVFVGGSSDVSSTFQAENTVIARNESLGQGGGFFNSVFSTVDLLNCTLGENVASDVGGAAYNLARFQADNTILWANDPDAISNFADGFSVVNTSIIQEGHAKVGNLDIDPRFRLTDIPYPFMLSWDSPAIDAGVAPSPIIDLAGQARPQNAAPDMGAFEFEEDSDGGGLPDSFETEYGLNIEDPSDDSEDSDEDGVENREEFRRDSDPTDPTSPVRDFYVAAIGGSDQNNDGTELLPWKTISFALNSVLEGTSDFQIIIHLGPGIYQEQVTLRPYVTLRGGDAATTTIQYYSSIPDGNKVVVFAEGSGLEHVTVTTPTAQFANIILGEARDAAISCFDVRFEGKDNPDGLGLFITGIEGSNSIIWSSSFRQIGYGIQAVNSAPRITQNTFEDIRSDAIFVRPPEKEISKIDETPRVGDVNDASTGFNIFRNVTGFFIKNEATTITKAELNDWGVYTDDEVAAKMSDDVDFIPYLKATTIPGSLGGKVIDDTNSKPLLSAKHPKIKVVTTDGSITDTPGRDGSYLFISLKPGSVRITVTADGYKTQVLTKSILSNQTTQATIRLKLAGADPNDVDGNNEIDAVDVQLVINGALGLDTGGLSTDVTGDGNVDAVDVQTIINAVLGV